MEGSNLIKQTNKTMILFLLTPILLPFIFNYLNLNFDPLLKINIPSSLMLLSTFLLLPKFNQNTINSGIVIIMVLFSYLFSFLIYPYQITIISIILPFIIIFILLTTTHKFISHELLEYININKFYLILIWLLFVLSSSILSYIEMLKLNNILNISPVILISTLLGWYGKLILFDEFKDHYSYVKVFAIQLLLFVIIGLFYDIIIGDLFSFINSSIDGSSVWILTIVYTSSELISKVCYEEFIK
jgi:hypothetical protein